MSFKILPTCGLKIFQIKFITDDESGVDYGDFLLDCEIEDQNLSYKIAQAAKIACNVENTEEMYDKPENDFPPGFEPSPKSENQPPTYSTPTVGGL